MILHKLGKVNLLSALALTMPIEAASALQIQESDHVVQGNYESQDGGKFTVSVEGSSVLSITGPEKICLSFRLDKREDEIKNSTVIKGQECDNPAIKWIVGFDKSKPGTFILFPPGVFENDKVRTIFINFRNS